MSEKSAKLELRSWTFAAKRVNAVRRAAGVEVISSIPRAQSKGLLGINRFSLQRKLGNAEVVGAVGGTHVRGVHSELPPFPVES